MTFHFDQLAVLLLFLRGVIGVIFKKSFPEKVAGIFFNTFRYYIHIFRRVLEQGIKAKVVSFPRLFFEDLCTWPRIPIAAGSVGRYL